MRELDVVRQIETTLGLHHEGEHGKHVAILAVELELAFLFEPIDVVVAHGHPQLLTASSASRPSPGSETWPTHAKDNRCTGVGPRRSRTSRWSGVPYPRL